MRRMARAARILTVLTCLLLILGIGGVRGEWFYEGKKYGEVILTPVLNIPDNFLSESQQTLINNIIGELDDPNSDIHGIITTRFEGFLGWGLATSNQVGSMDPGMFTFFQSVGDRLTSLLGNPEGEFIIDFIDVTKVEGEDRYEYNEFVIYSTVTGLPTPVPTETTYIEDVYKSTFVKNADGNWELAYSTHGYAECAAYKLNGSFAGLYGEVPAWDTTTWKVGGPPTT